MFILGSTVVQESRSPAESRSPGGPAKASALDGTGRSQGLKENDRFPALRRLWPDGFSKKYWEPLTLRDAPGLGQSRGGGVLT